MPHSSSKLATLKPFLTYGVTAGQQYAAALDFAPLPKNVAKKDRSITKGL